MDLIKQPFYPSQSYTLNPPAIIDQDGSSPRSALFDDVYFMPGMGFAEVDHVFLGGNGLPAAWDHPDHPYYPSKGPSFTIVELGFGTGLNVFRAASLWLARQVKAGRCWRQLHIITTERFPLAVDQLATYASQHDLDAPLLTAFFRWYPENLQGQYRFRYRRGEQSIVIDLLLGDAAAMLSQLRLPRRSFDALFLDGFAPQKNPDLWGVPILRTLALGAKPGHTRFATFSAARAVRDSLGKAGFSWQKVPGIKGKRHNTIGGFRLPEASWAESKVARDAAQHSSRHALPKGAQVAVIGAGLAGCQAAHALSLRGFAVTVIDGGSQVASGASGNHQGALYTRITKAPTEVSRFYLRAFFYARQQLSGIGGSLRAGVFQPQPLLGLLGDSAAKADAEALLDRHKFSERFLRISSENGRDWLSHQLSAAIAPRALCQRLLASASQPVTLRLGCFVRALQPMPRADQEPSADKEPSADEQPGWQVLLESGERLSFTAVVIATSYQAPDLWPLSFTGIRPIRGQVTYLDDRFLPRRAGILTDDRYLLPPLNGIATAGASFNLHSMDPELTAADRQDNLRAASELLGQRISAGAVIGGRVSFRGSSRDYLPIVGAVPDEASFRREFGYLSHDAKQPVDLRRAAYVPGLFVTIGHGSRGLTSTPLSGEILAAMMAGEPSPVEHSVLCSLAPERFLLRELARG